jgi:hypothetical protein
MAREPLAHLPALIALALAAISLPARAQTMLLVSCSGAPLPANPGQRGNRECDQACHVGCSRQKKTSDNNE